jgi:hypothetical protein
MKLKMAKIRYQSHYLIILGLALSLSACPDPEIKPISEAGVEAGEGSIIVAGEQAGEQAGTQAGETEGGEDTGGEAGETANTEAGEAAGENAGVDAGEDAGEPAGELAGEVAGEPAGEEAGEPAGEEAGEPAGDPLDPYPSAECELDSDCGSFERCQLGVCRFDLRPNVYRMAESQISEPELAAGLLQAALNSSVNNETLNLLFEPGFYTEEGDAYFFIGNGLPSVDGYTFRRTFPIQNFVGGWYMTESEDGEAQPIWVLDGQRPFYLAFPTGFVNPQDQDTFGERFQCINTSPIIVNVTITPLLDESGSSYERIIVSVRGFIRHSDVEQIRIFFNDREINFVDYFENIEKEDLDGDGEFAEYPFDLDVIALPVPFLEELARPDRLDLRDPSPMVTQPPECSGN